MTSQPNTTSDQGWAHLQARARRPAPLTSAPQLVFDAATLLTLSGGWYPATVTVAAQAGLFFLIAGLTAERTA